MNFTCQVPNVYWMFSKTLSKRPQFFKFSITCPSFEILQLWVQSSIPAALFSNYLLHFRPRWVRFLGHVLPSLGPDLGVDGTNRCFKCIKLYPVFVVVVNESSCVLKLSTQFSCSTATCPVKMFNRRKVYLHGWLLDAQYRNSNSTFRGVSATQLVGPAPSYDVLV